MEQLTAVPTVNIPLDEYRAFIEWKVKGSTVEIPLEEYNNLKGQNMELQDRLRWAERHIEELEQEEKRQQDRRNELNRHTDVVTRTVANEITEKVMKDLLRLTEEQKKEIREKWEVKGGLSDKK